MSKFWKATFLAYFYHQMLSSNRPC
jgi:hypothetical protein